MPEMASLNSKSMWMWVGRIQTNTFFKHQEKLISKISAPFYKLYVYPFNVHAIMCMVFVYSILLTWLKLNTAQGSQNKAKVVSAEPLKMGSHSQTWNWKLDQTIKEND